MFWVNTSFIGYKENKDNYILNTFKYQKFDVHILYINDTFYNFRIDYYE